LSPIAFLAAVSLPAAMGLVYLTLSSMLEVDDAYRVLARTLGSRAMLLLTSLLELEAAPWMDSLT
jgi:hypothetical protein